MYIRKHIKILEGCLIQNFQYSNFLINKVSQTQGINLGTQQMGKLWTQFLPNKWDLSHRNQDYNMHIVVFGFKNVQYVASLMQHGQEKKHFGKLF